MFRTLLPIFALVALFAFIKSQAPGIAKEIPDWLGGIFILVVIIVSLIRMVRFLAKHHLTRNITPR